jgi:CBS domain-containing protein
MFAKDLMTSDPALVSADDSITNAALLMRTRGIGILPVVDDLSSRRLVGVITDRDIVVRHVALSHGPSARVRDQMTRLPITTVSPDSPLSEVTQRMTRSQVRRLPVVDDNGVVLGVIAQADLARRLAPRDPGLVGWVTEGIARAGALVH